jgi:hypothetical protein
MAQLPCSMDPVLTGLRLQQLTDDGKSLTFSTATTVRKVKLLLTFTIPNRKLRFQQFLHCRVRSSSLRKRVYRAVASQWTTYYYDSAQPLLSMGCFFSHPVIVSYTRQQILHSTSLKLTIYYHSVISDMNKYKQNSR